MRLLELSLSGFGSYSRETHLDLRNVGVCAVTGHNGAGKSTLFDAILWALYGAVPGKAANDLVNDGGGPARVILTVQVGSEVHTFRRERPLGDKTGIAEYSSSGKGTISGARAVTAEAEHLLNCPRDILALTALSRQGDSGRFGSMDAGRRRSALTSVLLADVFEEPLQLAEDAHTRTVALTVRTARDLAAVEAKAQELEKATEAVEKASETVELAAEELERAEKEASTSKGVSERLKRAEAAQARATRYRSEMEQALKDAESASNDQVVAQGLLGGAEHEALLSDLSAEEAKQEADQTSNDAAIAAKAASDAPERIAMLERGEAECWTCGSELGKETIARTIQELKELLDQNDEAQQIHRQAQRVASQASSTATQKTREVEALRKDIALAETTIRERTKLATSAQHSWKEAEAEASELEELRRLAKEEPDPRVLTSARSKHNQAQQDLGRARRWLEETTQASEALPEAREIATQAADEARGVELLKQSLGPSGLPHLALETVMNKLSIASNDALRQLGHLQIRFVLDDAAKSNPPLSIEARDGWTAEWRSYGTFSGGERMKMDIALRVGLTRVIGVRCRTMVLDEGWGTLDAASAASLARLLMQLIRSGGIDAFYTISHVSSAVDEFDHRIEVKRGINGSEAVLITAS